MLLAVGVGGPVRPFTAVVAVPLTIGAVNAYLAGASRLGVALTRDGALPARAVGTPRRSLAFITLASCAAVLVLNGPPALLSLAMAAGAVLYVSRRTAPKIASPSSSSAGSIAPNPNTNPVEPPP